MEIKGLSGKEICAIIKSCADAKVRELNLGSMQISFGTSQGEPASAPSLGTNLPSPEKVETSQEQKTEQNESFLDAMKSRMDEEIMQTQTLMDNPVQFEEEVIASFYEKEDGQQ